MCKTGRGIVIVGLFCHSLPIYKDINGVYCSTTLTDDLFKRYFDVVDKLYVATRVYQIDKTFEEAHQEKITLEKVYIIKFENLNDPITCIKTLVAEKQKMTELIEKSDLLFIRGGVIALLAAEIAQKKKRAYLMECAGCIFDEYWYYSLLGKFIAPLLELKVKKAIKNAAYVLYVTEKWLQNRYPTKGKTEYASNVILNGIDEAALTRRLEKIRNKNNNKILLGTTAGLSTKAKGQQYVIKILKKLSKKYDIRYQMVGSGDNSYLKSVSIRYGVSDYVDFKGQLTHEEVLSWLDSLDVYIQPSMQEGLPRALIEAMSRACPAVGSTTAGIPEILEPEYVFHRGKTKDLYRIIDKILISNLKQRAVRNFEKSKEFEFDKLQTRRSLFYKEYRDFIMGSKIK